MNKHQILGFTIIELVIVMLVIGILSAVAMPRMVKLGSQARKNTTSTIASNFKMVIELARSEWVAGSEPKYIIVDNTYFWMGDGEAGPGWPQNVSSANDSAAAVLTPTECLNLWNKLLKNPPLADIVAGCTNDNTCKYYVTQEDEICSYTDKDSNTITYDRTSGEVGFNNTETTTSS